MPRRPRPVISFDDEPFNTEEKQSQDNDGGGTFYDLLGVQPTACDAEIRKAFKKKILEFHPDRNVGRSNNGECEEMTQKLVEAYNVLRDPFQRREYNENGYQVNSKSSSNFEFDLNTVWKEFFGNDDDDENDSACRTIHVYISLRDAANGVPHYVVNDVQSTPCECTARTNACSSCRGTGWVAMFGAQTACSSCDGTGQQVERFKSCSRCAGTGVEEIVITYHVSIPCGVKPNTKIPTETDPSVSIIVCFEGHPYFSVNEENSLVWDPFYISTWENKNERFQCNFQIEHVSGRRIDISAGYPILEGLMVWIEKGGLSLENQLILRCKVDDNQWHRHRILSFTAQYIPTCAQQYISGANRSSLNCRQTISRPPEKPKFTFETQWTNWFGAHGCKSTEIIQRAADGTDLIGLEVYFGLHIRGFQPIFESGRVGQLFGQHSYGDRQYEIRWQEMTSFQIKYDTRRVIGLYFWKGKKPLSKNWIGSAPNSVLHDQISGKIVGMEIGLSGGGEIVRMRFLMEEKKIVCQPSDIRTI